MLMNEDWEIENYADPPAYYALAIPASAIRHVGIQLIFFILTDGHLSSVDKQGSEKWIQIVEWMNLFECMQASVFHEWGFNEKTASLKFCHELKNIGFILLVKLSLIKFPVTNLTLIGILFLLKLLLTLVHFPLCITQPPEMISMYYIVLNSRNMSLLII